MSAERDTLRECADELEQAALRLRAGQVGGEEAAELVERCAELAGRISDLLEEEGREMAAEPPADDGPEQERLL